MAREVVPRDHMAPGAEWPDGELADDAPATARLGQIIAQALRRVIVQRALGARELARLAQMSHPTIKSMLDGERLPSVHTLFLLERALQAPLYPGDLYRTSERGDEQEGELPGP